RKLLSIMDIKCEAKLKDKVSANTEEGTLNDHHIKQASGFKGTLAKRINVKNDIEVDNDPLNIVVEDVSNSQISELDKSQEETFCSFFGVKGEIEVKDEPLEIKEGDSLCDHLSVQVSGLHENQERNFRNIIVKTEIEVKDGLLNFEEDVLTNQLFEQGSGLDEKQV
ncbi:hypothetical protein Avbf_02287, partial [Armadillidium vulgare]